jgi:hypothetical protein
MQKTTMGALLLSLLVFPGAGHLVLGRWLRGILWGSVFGAAGLAVLLLIGVNVPQMLDAMMSPTGDVPLIDPQQLGLAVLFAMVAFGAYFAAAVDCWWLGRRAAAQDQPAGSSGLAADEQQVVT